MSTANSNNNNNNALTTTTATGRRRTSSWYYWWLFRRISVMIRYIRIPILVISVYSIGYQQGIIDCTKTPHKLQQSLLDTIVMENTTTTTSNRISSSSSSGEDDDDNNNKNVPRIRILQSTDVPNYYTSFLPSTASSQQEEEDYHRVVRVGNRILDAARRYVQEQLDAAIYEQQQQQQQEEQRKPKQQQQRAAIPQGNNNNDENNNNNNILFWMDAKVRLDGEQQQQSQKQQQKQQPQSWQYIIIRNDDPNAFVTELLPYRFFITTGLLENIIHTNDSHNNTRSRTRNNNNHNHHTVDDELAFVFGHELSHLLLGHASKSNQLETILRTIEVLLLSMDPTAGFVAMSIMTMIISIRHVITSASSREQEYEADTLGLELTARACYDTKHAPTHVMMKLHHHRNTTIQQQQEQDNKSIMMNLATSLYSFIMSSFSSSSSSTATNDDDNEPSATKNNNNNNDNDGNDNTTTTVANSSSSSSSSVFVSMASTMFDSHPPSLERAQRLQQLNQTHHMNQYDECIGITGKLYKSMRQQFTAAGRRRRRSSQ